MQSKSNPLLLLLLPLLATTATCSLPPVKPVKSYGVNGGYACCKHLSPAHSAQGISLLELSGNDPFALDTTTTLVGSECRTLPRAGCGEEWFVGCVPYLAKDVLQGSVCIAREMGDGKRVAEFLYDLGDMIQAEVQEGFARENDDDESEEREIEREDF
ncbi:hypothetical protein P175DRAFT_0521310 [Aspergillus ochraceoroseus IBT 24754]|uniref:Uncharacterized protein n=1 Tax=Aspergillus ochraceoroseus IBT 24754 TaxID=1392256 RepID=A0A2T5MAI7_9EURO|nr:uncharacterized protein P175DRAFT_0521310 [Aspergillus ochraceoroseus IBT 24754]PTU25558.1 hypothetical protein P175DRAFT_0521310 [Aspergillus ochraceoroseus IBT 24754]